METFKQKIMKIKYRTQLPELLEHYNLVGDAAEIGVAENRNGSILIASPNIRKMYFIDAWQTLTQAGDGGYPQSWHDNNWKEAHERVESWKEKAVFLKGLSSEMIQKIPDNSLVLGYIDGDHSYSGCLSDLIAIYPKIKSGGIVAGHDYLNMTYGVNAAVKHYISVKGYNLLDIETTEEDGDTSMVSFWFIKK